MGNYFPTFEKWYVNLKKNSNQIQQGATTSPPSQTRSGLESMWILDGKIRMIFLVFFVILIGTLYLFTGFQPTSNQTAIVAPFVIAFILTGLIMGLYMVWGKNK
jgi:hypothetical protein